MLLQTADKYDDWFMRRARERALKPQGLLGTVQDAPKGLLAPAASPAAASPAPAAPIAPAVPQRARVSPFRILDRVLGGQTVTEGLDAERARLEQEAMRPTILARQAQMRAFAEQMGPAAMIAFETNPEKFGEELASQFSPQVIAAGGIQSIAGTGQQVGAPTVREFGDRLAMTDPVTRATTYSEARQPTFAEETGRINANNPVNVATGGKLVDPRTGAVVAEGNPQVYSAANGSDLVRADGTAIYQNAPTPPAPTAAMLEMQGQLASIDTDVTPTIARMETLLKSGDVITGFGAQARMQAARALAAAGNEQARRQVAATEEFINTSGRLRVGMAKSLGANPSNADIQLLERVTAGDISQSQAGLLATIQQGRELSTRQRQALQQRLGSSQSPAGAPQVGQIEDGYRFKGGNPADPSAWERVN